MNNESSYDADAKALERAAKYICNLQDGLCPMAVEDFHCRSTCDSYTLPWKCWVMLFKESPEKSTMYKYKKMR